MSKKLEEREQEQRKELLMAFANLMTSKLTHEEIEIFCISMLHANKLCQMER